MSVAHDVCAHESTVYPAHVDLPSLDLHPGSSGICVQREMLVAPTGACVLLGHGVQA